jgi:hypothetical protein
MESARDLVLKKATTTDACCHRLQNINTACLGAKLGIGGRLIGEPYDLVFRGRLCHQVCIQSRTTHRASGRSGVDVICILQIQVPYTHSIGYR